MLDLSDLPYIRMFISQNQLIRVNETTPVVSYSNIIFVII